LAFALAMPKLAQAPSSEGWAFAFRGGVAWSATLPESNAWPRRSTQNSQSRQRKPRRAVYRFHRSDHVHLTTDVHTTTCLDIDAPRWSSFGESGRRPHVTVTLQVSEIYRARNFSSR
jgi:hypothetical protein